MAYATAQSVPSQLGGRTVTAEQPGIGSIDDTIAMIQEISGKKQVGADKIHWISFRELVFPPAEGSDYQKSRERYDSFLRELAPHAHVRPDRVINVNYLIMHKEGPEGYILIGTSPFLPGENPHYRFTYYLDGGQFGKPDGKPDAICRYEGTYEGSAAANLFNGKDPARVMKFNPMPEVVRFKANPDFDELLKWTRELFRKTRGRDKPKPIPQKRRPNS